MSMSEAIRIAIGAPLSGNAAALGAEMKAIELAVEEQNADGGIAGVRIIVEGADDQGKVETGRQVADDFCSRPDLLGVVGHYNSNVTIAAAEIYAAHDLPMITPIASDTALTERSLPNVSDRSGLTTAAVHYFLDTLILTGGADRLRTSTVPFSGKSQTFEIGRNTPPFVIPGRSKERSDAAQTLGSMPLPGGSAPADQNRTLPPERRSEPLHSSADVTAWSPRRRFAPAPPWDDEGVVACG
jgi:hypothetical protein